MSGVELAGNVWAWLAGRNARYFVNQGIAVLLLFGIFSMGGYWLAAVRPAERRDLMAEIERIHSRHNETVDRLETRHAAAIDGLRKAHESALGRLGESIDRNTVAMRDLTAEIRGEWRDRRERANRTPTPRSSFDSTIRSSDP